MTGRHPARRPDVVTAACLLMFGVAGLNLLDSAVTVAVTDDIAHAFVSEVRGRGVSPELVDMFLAANRLAFLASAGLAFLLAVAYGVAGALNLRGVPAGRIVAWVTGGLFVLCVAGSVPGAAGGPLGSIDAQSDAVNQAIRAATPVWYVVGSLATAIVGALASVVVMVLLALPAANHFFRAPASDRAGT